MIFTLWKNSEEIPKKFFPDNIFTKLPVVEIFDDEADEKSGEIFPFYSTISSWKHIPKNLLESAANDEIRVFFVDFSKKIILAPYDGGMDIIFPDEKTRENYKKIFQNWLSNREDGL